MHQMPHKILVAEVEVLEQFLTGLQQVIQEVVLVVPVSSSSPTHHKYLKNHNDIHKGHQ
jgi:hypothetical protein